MCLDKIVEKGGLREKLFEEHHFQRKSVGGSINGWVAPPKEKLNEIVGFSPENIEIEHSIHSRKEMLQIDMNIPMFNPCSEGSADDPLPLDYFPEQSVVTNPFIRNELENVLRGVMSGYNSFSCTRKHTISLLVLQLEELMISDEKTFKVVKEQHNTCLLAPSTITQ